MMSCTKPTEQQPEELAWQWLQGLGKGGTAYTAQQNPL